MSSPTPGKGRFTRMVGETFVAVAIGVALLASLEGGASALVFLRDARNVSVPSTLTRARSVPDTLLGWRPASSLALPDAFGPQDAFTTTAEGYRSTGRPIAADSVVTSDIVCSGDAFTVGIGVGDERTWCARLQQEIPGTRTVNMSAEHFGLDQLFLWYRRDRAASPTTLHVLTITNAELQRSATAEDAGWPKPLLEVEGDQLVTLHTPLGPETPGHFKRAAIVRNLGSLRVVQALRKFDALNPSIRNEGLVDERRPVVERLVGELASLHERNHTRFALVYLPGSDEAKPNARLDARRAWLAAYAGTIKVPFIDVTPALRALRGDSLDIAFFARNSTLTPSGAGGQYSAMGHEWLARELARQLRPMVGREPVADSAAGLVR